MKYNFGSVSNIEDFFNEISMFVELTENEDHTITSINEFGEETIYTDLSDLNDFANEYFNALIDGEWPLDRLDYLIDNFTEPFVPVLIKPSEITNETIIKNLEYKIYTYIDDYRIRSPFGDNRLIVRNHGISFIIQEKRPFKLHRHILGLESEVKLYIGFAEEFFSHQDGITVETYTQPDDYELLTPYSIYYSIQLYSNYSDVSKFLDMIFDFTSKFDDKLTNIEREVAQTLGIEQKHKLSYRFF